MLLQKATEANIPVFSTDSHTSAFMAEIIRWLNVQLAPCISIHGVLVDVYGVGVLIMGESGIGKSEAALELIKRGHRLVSDDVVEIRKVSDETLVGTAPDITRHFIELRGIGIVDVKTLFGVQSVRETKNIDLVITLEEWNKEREYDRLGLEDQYTEFLGNKVVCHNLPIRPGRNLAIIVETAAINHRQKSMGYNAAQELYQRVQRSLTKKRLKYIHEEKITMKYCFGADVGGTTIKLGLFTVDGEILDKWEIITRTENEGESILQDIATALKEKIQEKAIPAEEVIGIGMGIPAPVNSEGIVRKTANLGWGYKEVKKELENLTGWQVVVAMMPM